MTGAWAWRRAGASLLRREGRAGNAGRQTATNGMEQNDAGTPGDNPVQWWPRGDRVADGRAFRSRTRRGDAAPDRGRAQLYRYLSPARDLPRRSSWRPGPR